MIVRTMTCAFAFAVLYTAAASENAPNLPSPGKASANLAVAKVFAFDAMPVTHNPNGSTRYSVVAGALASGEPVEVHQSVQPPGITPNPPHTIQHSEFIVVQEGTLTVAHDGKEEIAGPGSVIYIAYGTMHQARNAGTVPARYTVISIGGDAK